MWDSFNAIRLFNTWYLAISFKYMVQQNIGKFLKRKMEHLQENYWCQGFHGQFVSRNCPKREQSECRNIYSSDTYCVPSQFKC